MDRKKIHELLDLILEIQERGEGKDGYPYVSIEFSNYGNRCVAGSSPAIPVVDYCKVHPFL